MVPCSDRLEFETIEVDVTVKLQIFSAKDLEGKYYIEFTADSAEGQTKMEHYKAFQIVKKQLLKTASSTNVKVTIE